MRRANGRGDRRVQRALWPGLDADALLVAPLVAGDEQLGILSCVARGREFTPEDRELLDAVAHQTAVGLKKAELIERLTAENIVKDMFDALAAGSTASAEAKAGEARCDLSRPHLFLHVERALEAGEEAPSWPELAARLQARLRQFCPRAFFDARHDRVRALAPLATGDAAALNRLRDACEEIAREEGLVIGLSDVDRGAASARRRMREAADAARIGHSLFAAGGAVSYEGWGPTSTWCISSSTMRPRTATGSRSSSWWPTTGAAARACSRPSSSSWPTAAASPPAPARSTSTRTRSGSGSTASSGSPGLRLPDEDLLSLELALKLARLHRVRAGAE